MKIQKTMPISTEYLESIGFSWHTDNDGTPYASAELVEISSKQADEYYEAVNQLYDMFVNAAQYVIDNDLFFELGIPYNLIDLIKQSWENDVHWHLYGRFDLAGGLDGKPIKLIEFNADTPTAVFETAILQWAILKQNGLDEAAQFNDLFDGLVENFKRLMTLDDDTSEFDELYAQNPYKILFTCIEGNSEDEATTRLIQACANRAGFNTRFAYIHEISFDDENGIFVDGQNYEFLFKLIPWEQIAVDEGELGLILQNIIKNQKAIILNPAYTLLFQSKGIMKILWDLYPNHPLLLHSSYEPLANKKQVKKPFLAREGANVSIISQDGVVLEKTAENTKMANFYTKNIMILTKMKKGKNIKLACFFPLRVVRLDLGAGLRL